MSIFSSERPNRLKSSLLLHARESESPTLTSSRSESSLWARSYKNQPIPAKLMTRLVGKKYQFCDDQDDDQEIMAVAEEQEDEQAEKNEKKKTRLPKFKVINDWDEFSDSRRSRINSERKFNNTIQRCHSVASLRLPQVLEDKREDDDLRKRGISKFAEFKDKNEFGDKPKRRSSSDYTEAVSHAESMFLPTQLIKALPEQILQNQAEETKSVKLAKQKSIIAMELQKLIVDELDEFDKKKQEYKQIESIIQQEKPQDGVNTEKLSQLLQKFQQQSSYLTKLNDKQDFSRKMDKVDQSQQHEKQIKNQN